ncbi:histidine phosphatase family protein [Endozoicomonas euniceicola]|uniref:Multiple inositol polyphosphate phosphatase 1 n=1 Tax=Endozoicomonas euniceicola TaxID=1234143 RepID=A0ABY6H300_9GAMM|nr:histidine phosphatase family protein [Endozoicomonas euniceicola]UYM18631.1 histidine phosphatase family protein [Endozoicomonas euniceicola]
MTLLPKPVVLVMLLIVADGSLAIEEKNQACTPWRTIVNSDDQNAIESHLNNKRPYPGNRREVSAPFSSCSMVHTIYLGRHASRHVTKNEKLSEIEQELNELLKGDESTSSELTLEGIKIIQNIKRLRQFVEKNELAGSITSLGKQELNFITRRFASGVNIAPFNLKPATAIRASTSKTLRTRQSLEAFMDGLKGWSVNSGLSFEPDMAVESADQILRSYKSCPERTGSYETTRDKLKKSRQELVDDSQLSFDLAQSFTKKTMTSKNKLKVMELLYNLCQIESSFPEKERYNFCQYFLNESNQSGEEMKLLGKMQNLKQWHKRGFASGNRVMFNLAAPIQEQVISRLTAALSPKQDQPLLSLWFTHDSTMVAMIMLMGYLGDNPDYSDWDADLITPMSGNIQWRVYQCGRDHRVQILLNEIPVCLDDCPDAFCSLTDYISRSAQKLQEIDFKGECGVIEEDDFSAMADDDD